MLRDYFKHPERINLTVVLEQDKIDQAFSKYMKELQEVNEKYSDPVIQICKMRELFGDLLRYNYDQGYTLGLSVGRKDAKVLGDQSN